MRSGVLFNDWLSEHEMCSEYSVNRPVEYANSVFLPTDHSLVVFWGTTGLCVVTGF
jgi:hypothetical protein